MRKKTDDVQDPSADEIAVSLRQLALVDRIIGLEAEVARLSASSPVPSSARNEITRMQQEVNAVYGSKTWRVGSIVLRPFRMLKSSMRR